MRNSRVLISALAFTAMLAVGDACAQIVQFPRTGNIGTAPAAAAPPVAGSPYGSAVPSLGSGGTVPADTIPRLPGASIYAPPAGYSAPAFDPYSTAPGVPNPWSTAPSPFTAPPASGGFSPPASPFANPSPGAMSPPISGSPYIGSGAYPSQTPNSLFPNGLWGSNPNVQPYDYSQTLRLIQEFRLTHTYLGSGSDPADVNINDSVASVMFAFPNFLGSGQPLFISPTFGIHLWDGPHSLPADLPPSAYSAFLDTQFSTDPNQQLGAELGFRIGVYSDFETFNSHSLRIQGLGVGKLKITPTTTLKIGAIYIDRNDLKILPAAGILWQPTPQIRFDIFFPQPKLATYLTTVNNHEFWWYLAGEYGGGAWTIQRTSGVSDRMDINDIRASIGLETAGQGRLSGFAEVGYVFNRQVVYVVAPGDTFEPGNTFTVRLGFSF